MQRRPGATWLWLGLLALGGLLSGHLLSYFAVAPEAHVRAELLASTGHSQHGVFATVALAAIFAALVGIFMDRVRSHCGRRGRGVSRARVAATLWAAQTAGFLVLEAWERGHGLEGVPELFHEPAFLVGLVAQVLVALAAAAIVSIVDATAGALLRLLGAFDRSTETTAFPDTTTFRPRCSVARAAWNLRGPPSPAGFPS